MRIPMLTKDIAVSMLVCLTLAAGASKDVDRERSEKSRAVPSDFLRLWYGQADTLKGLERVQVTVAFNGDAGELGLSLEELRAHVERRLEQNNVPTVSKPEYERQRVFAEKIERFVARGYEAMKYDLHPAPTDDYGYVLCTICTRSMQNFIAVDLRLGLSQTGLLPATLPDQIMMSPCITWIDGILGVCPEQHVKEAIVSGLDELADRFSRDYVEANGKVQRTQSGATDG